MKYKLAKPENNTYPYPDPDTIPDVAYLVIGAAPGEESTGRTYDSNPAYYTFDNILNDEADNSRHIHGNFDNLGYMTRLSTLYCQKFDTNIFDYSTYKFMDKQMLFFFLKMLKPNGVFIIEMDTFPIGDMNWRANYTNEEKKQRAKVIRQTVLNNKIQTLKETYKFTTTATTFNSLIADNPVAKSVYGPLIANGVIPDGNGNCIIIKKERIGSGGKRNKKSKRKTRRAMKSKQ